jgi:hypothetical protein
MVGLLLWLAGVLILLFLKCATQKDATKRAYEVRCSIGGRCLTKSGCTCAYFGSFVLCFFSIILIIISPVLYDVVTVYYAAPANLEPALEVRAVQFDWRTITSYPSPRH